MLLVAILTRRIGQSISCPSLEDAGHTFGITGQRAVFVTCGKPRNQTKENRTEGRANIRSSNITVREFNVGIVVTYQHHMISMFAMTVPNRSDHLIEYGICIPTTKPMAQHQGQPLHKSPRPNTQLKDFKLFATTRDK